MTRVTRVPRTPSISKPEPEKSSLPDIPVTPMTLFFGFIGLSMVAGVLASGYHAVARSVFPATVSQCIAVEIAAPEKAREMKTSEWADDSDRVQHGRSIEARTAAEDIASNCPVDTCEGEDLQDYKAKMNAYLRYRMARLRSLSREYGQSGVDSIVDFYDTFADRRIENRMVEMVKVGKLVIDPEQVERGDPSALAVSMLVKYGRDSLVPCGSKQELGARGTSETLKRSSHRHRDPGAILARMAE